MDPDSHTCEPYPDSSSLLERNSSAIVTDSGLNPPFVSAKDLSFRENSLCVCRWLYPQMTGDIIQGHVSFCLTHQFCAIKNCELGLLFCNPFFYIPPRLGEPLSEKSSHIKRFAHRGPGAHREKTLLQAKADPSYLLYNDPHQSDA